LWLQGVAIILPQVGKEFNPPHETFLTLALYVGLIIGASFWGIGADLMGRQLAFNLTLFIASAFGLAAGGATNFVGVASMIACVGLGTGGNLPVDGAIFLEFVPGTHQYLLTMYFQALTRLMAD
jgi:MFS family permease